jgi:hypothetical protein
VSTLDPSAVAQTPILDSGILPLQNPSEITVITILGSIGGSLIAVIQALTQPRFGILLYFAALPIAILIHELGHLTAGWCVGFRFRCIAVGPFALRLERGSPKLRWLRELTASGYADMSADTVPRLRHRLLLYMLGGVIANLGTVPIAMLFAQTSFATTHPLFLSLAYQLVMVSVLSAVLSLLPLPVGIRAFTDGFRVATLLRDRQRSRRLLSIYAVGAQRRNGTAPQKLEANLAKGCFICVRWLD